MKTPFVGSLNTNHGSEILTGIKQLFVQTVVFYEHERQQYLIQVNYYSSLERVFPAFVEWGVKSCKTISQQKIRILNQFAVKQLTDICKKINIDFDVNSWIDHLHRAVQTLLPTCTKTSLIFHLHGFFNVQRDFYMTIPYLKKIFTYVMVATVHLRELHKPKQCK